ncbi:maleylpyruvate isomerase family mycothiol-dependent enzyme [Actinoplanes subtropicus]|uniref:maleylpyruvate isomerase family mycothiol-dependent enzyme n=1 Tax=Actinoplanes subtropicus TaxID=543632 RepID=UPI00068E594C|nr:maleylpyruvate isomerase family mycothiol-dependent enzyme [Actinoplanes subtropicus]
MDFDPGLLLSKIMAATEQLLETAADFDDAGVRQPSLLPGWSRGHVLTHVARNADGGTRMLTWARTGLETPEYPSVRARAEEIEAGSGRPATALTADVRASASRFADAYAAMPGEAWSRLLRWTSGKQRPAYRAADARLTEVLVHHVDLRAGYQPRDWPADFVAGFLADVIAAFAGRTGVPSLYLIASDTGAGYRLGGHEGALVVRAEQASLLAWLLGRSKGGNDLPALPFLY